MILLLNIGDNKIKFQNWYKLIVIITLEIWDCSALDVNWKKEEKKNPNIEWKIK